jgi:hypothetical protein
MIQIKAVTMRGPILMRMDWQLTAIAPFDRDLELAVITYDGPHTLVFPCRRVLHGWINAESKKAVDVRPTHWREWPLARPRL